MNVNQDLVTLKPESLRFAEAAAVPLAAQTALLALEKSEVGKGSYVCIIGASGGVGCFMVQMAKVLVPLTLSGFVVAEIASLCNLGCRRDD